MAKKLKPARYTAKKVSPDSYEALDGEWRAIGLSGPARRALVDAKLYKVSDLRRISLAELSAIKGLAKSAIARIRQIMEARRIYFR
jgi:hypothetical protein